MIILSPAPASATYSVHATAEAVITANVHKPQYFSSLDRAVQSFRRCLANLGYSARACSEACLELREYQEVTSLVELGYLCPEDEAEAEAAFVDGFDAVHPSSPQWSDASTWSASIPCPAEAIEYARLSGAFDAAEAPLVAPPEFEREPKATDWDEWARWSATLDPTDPDRYLEAELAEIGCRR